MKTARQLALPRILIVAWVLATPAKVAGDAMDPLADIPSTSSELFMGNLERQIRYLTNRYEGSADASTGSALAFALWQKGLIYSDVATIGRALEIVETMVERTPDAPRLYVLRARLNMSLHRFATAQEDLIRAQALGAPSEALRPLLSEVLWNLGRCQEAVQLTAGRDRIKPEAASLNPADGLARARQDLAMRRYQGAAAWIEEAMRSLRDSSPLPAVALYLLRAEAAEQQGYAREARYFLERAVERLPQHIGAIEALAGVQLAAGELDSAIELLEGGRRLSQDPHLLIELARAYWRKGNIVIARSLRREAGRGFRRLLAKYPEVYAAEAADCWWWDSAGPMEARRWAQRAVKSHSAPALQQHHDSRKEPHRVQEKSGNTSWRQSARLPLQPVGHFPDGSRSAEECSLCRELGRGGTGWQDRPPCHLSGHRHRPGGQ